MVDKIYTKDVAKKYHFVEAFLKSNEGKNDLKVKTGEIYRKHSKKSSLHKLLSSNMLDDVESMNKLKATHARNVTNM